MKKTILMAHEINPETFNQKFLIWDIKENKFLEIDYESIENITPFYKYINIWKHIMVRAKVIEENINHEDFRWFDMETFILNLIHKNILKFDEKLISNDIYDLIRIRLFQDSLLNKIPFKIVLMTHPKMEINGKSLQAKTHLIELDHAFLSDVDLFNEVQNCLEVNNPDNKTVYIWKISSVTFHNLKKTVLRVRFVLEDDFILEDNI